MEVGSNSFNTKEKKHVKIMANVFFTTCTEQRLERSSIV